jgi:hypothetical protein
LDLARPSSQDGIGCSQDGISCTWLNLEGRGRGMRCIKHRIIAFAIIITIPTIGFSYVCVGVCALALHV